MVPITFHIFTSGASADIFVDILFGNVPLIFFLSNN